MKLIQNSANYNYGDKFIEYDIWSKRPLADVDTVLLLGTMQISFLARIVCRHTSDNVAVVQCAPHWNANPDGSDIPEFMLRFTECSIDYILGRSKSDHISLVSDSQAAPGLIRYCMKSDGRVKRLTLLQPLGLNATNFKNSSRLSIEEFRHRFRANLRYQLPVLFRDPNLLINHVVLMYLTLRESLSRRFDGQYGSGLKEDMIDDLKSITRSIQVQVIVGADDQLFPSREIIGHLNRAGLKGGSMVRVVPGVPHSSLASSQGRLLLDAIRIGQNA